MTSSSSTSPRRSPQCSGGSAIALGCVALLLAVDVPLPWLDTVLQAAQTRQSTGSLLGTIAIGALLSVTITLSVKASSRFLSIRVGRRGRRVRSDARTDVRITIGAIGFAAAIVGPILMVESPHRPLFYNLGVILVALSLPALAARLVARAGVKLVKRGFRHSQTRNLVSGRYLEALNGQSSRPALGICVAIIETLDSSPADEEVMPPDLPARAVLLSLSGENIDMDGLRRAAIATNPGMGFSSLGDGEAVVANQKSIMGNWVLSLSSVGIILVMAFFAACVGVEARSNAERLAPVGVVAGEPGLASRTAWLTASLPVLIADLTGVAAYALLPVGLDDRLEGSTRSDTLVHLSPVFIGAHSP